MVWFSAQAQDFSLLDCTHTSVKNSQSPIQWVPGTLPSDGKLTTHLPVVPRLRASGSIHLIPPYTLISSTGTNLIWGQTLLKHENDTLPPSSTKVKNAKDFTFMAPLSGVRFRNNFSLPYKRNYCIQLVSP